jgi:hypothetical protein
MLCGTKSFKFECEVAALRVHSQAVRQFARIALSIASLASALGVGTGCSAPAEDPAGAAGAPSSAGSPSAGAGTSTAATSGGTTGAAGGGDRPGVPSGGGGSGMAGSIAAAGMAGSISTAGAGGGSPASGYFIGATCFPACLSAASDADPNTGLSDGYGFENNASCVEPGSVPANGAPRCVPPPPSQPVNIPAGSGFYIAGVCEPRCASDATDRDPITGLTDGWGYENGASCVVVGSAPTLGVPTCMPAAAASGDGYLAGATCVPACGHPELADAQGYGYEAQESCVVASSMAATQKARCTLSARADLPPPGVGFENGQTCFPPCTAAALDLTADGYGWDANRTCAVKDSKAAIQGVPCVPPPSTVTGACPMQLVCPAVSGVTLGCGCTWIEGLGARKQVILGTSGASQYFVASAMMETAGLLANYALGDNKTQDSFNAGIAKQNWGMARRCHPAWSPQTAAEYATMAAMNTNLALDIQVYNECRTMFGANWWSGHRDGYNNLGMNTLDIQQFKAAMDWTNQMITTHLTDDVRFWVTIQAI